MNIKRILFRIKEIKNIIISLLMSVFYKYIQNKYDLSNIKKSKKLIVFLIPNMKIINGGIISIFNICKYSRVLCYDYCVLISTHPGKLTYTRNNKFKNNEKIYRWEQIVSNANNVDTMILHIPEYYFKYFYNKLTQKDLKILKSINKLQINIMNQNIEQMPSYEEIDKLKAITKNITQTIAHHKYATQEICDKYKIPTHFLSTYSDLSMYNTVDFKNKEKIIVVSPDENVNKEKIISKIKKELNEFKIVTIQNMTFNKYISLVTRSFFVITFGEGMDGYFNQPAKLRTVSFAVYNDKFFPSIEWSKMQNIYLSYNEMYSKIVDDMKFLLKNEDVYKQIYSHHKNMHSNLYSFEKFKCNLEEFYSGKIDFYPNE